MDLDLSDDQEALRGALRDFFEKEAPTPVVRAAEPLGFDAALWRKVVGIDILGAEGLLAPDAPGAPAGGEFEHDFRAAVVTTVYGGASEILRDIITQRHLGLPRNRPSR